MSKGVFFLLTFLSAFVHSLFVVVVVFVGGVVANNDRINHSPKYKITHKICVLVFGHRFVCCVELMDFGIFFCQG